MSATIDAQEVIKLLKTGGFYAECPCCHEPILLKNAHLFHLDEFTPEALDLYNGQVQELNEREKELKMKRKSIVTSSEIGAKAVNIGFILERLAPTMHGFRFDRNDCRSLFDPIDYVIFEGLNKLGRVSKIVFADIKTGGAKLKSNQKAIRSVIQDKRVGWDTYASEDIQ